MEKSEIQLDALYRPSSGQEIYAIRIPERMKACEDENEGKAAD